MTFEQAIASQSQWLQIWLIWLSVVVFVGPFFFLFSREMRRDTFIFLLVNICVYVAMMWLFQQVGFVRLLGAVHVIFWTPVALYLWGRLKNPAIVFPFRQLIWLILGTVLVSLVFDYMDVARYLMGDRANMVR